MDDKIKSSFYRKSGKNVTDVIFSDDLIKKIEKPSDLKCMSLSELKTLAAEIRGALLTNVSRTGGHLSSNLGVVELTIALHFVFDSPRDKIVWDVGHQCYTHKILTGRYSELGSLRQTDGISGFTNPDESVHDIFFSGHASTSVSAAYGIARANKLAGRNNEYAIAVVGDGACTGGEIYEALNNAGRERSNLIVILNDNEMSISKNIGSFAKHLAIIKSKPEYFNLKARAEQAINKIPVVGVELSDEIHKVKTAVKKVIYKSSTIFEELGFRYMGPIDGHNLAVLIDALEGAKAAHFPILLHIKTVKGKGYEIAQEHPDRFHGVGKFDVDSGECKPSGDCFSEEFGRHLCLRARENDKICAITAAMSIGTGLEPFKKEFPERFFDVGIAEQHAVTFSSGLAKGGMVPVFAVYSAFLQRGYDQLIHDIALQRLKVLFVVDRAGFVTGDGETHHGIFDVPFLNTMPNITVYSPCTYAGMRRDIDKALDENDGASVVRIFKGGECKFPKNVNLGENDVDFFGDDDARTAVVSYSRASFESFKAVQDLRKDGYKIKLIILNKIKPIPSCAIEAAATTKRVFFFDESIKNGCAGEIFLESLCENGYRGEFFLRAIDNEFVTHSTAGELMKKYGFDSESQKKFIEEKVKDERKNTT